MKLTFVLLTLRLTVHALASGEDFCQFALKSVHSFSKYSVHKLVTDERTDRRTDGRTKGQVENIMRSASLDWRTDKYMCTIGIAFVCFYHAEHILSAIAKFLVYLFGKWKGRGLNGRGEM